MDDTKDIQNTGALAHFLDGQNVRTNPFGSNRSAERAYRRAERLCAALYLLTNHIPGGENIRSEIRSEAMALLGDVLSLRDEMRSMESRKIIALQGRVRRLISLTRILAVSGFVSYANAETMTGALDELGNFMHTAQRSGLSESVSISREELMDIGSGAPGGDATKVIKDIRPRTTIKDKIILSDEMNPSGMSNTKGTTSVRVQNILEVLRVGGSLGIKDIAANLPEYSEKMIQRELLNMASTGRIRKIGLKRWSKYSLPA